MQQKHIIAIIYTIALFLDRLDITIVNTTLPTIAKVFNVPITATDCISLAFLLALAISIPISTWLGDRFGAKNIFILATLLFGIGSTACAFANSLAPLTILRFVQGIGGGMLIPVGMTLMYQVYDRSEYSSITSFTFITASMAPAIAPFMGGLLLDHLGWRFVYAFSGPICIVLAIFSFLFLKIASTKIYRPFDLPGFVLVSALLIDLFYMLSLISNTGFTRSVLYTFLVLIVLVTAFIYREHKTETPLLDLNFFKNDTFVKANFIQMCFQICHYGSIFLIGMYLQVSVGMTASIAGLVMGMQAFGAMCSSRISVKLFNQYGPKIPLTIGLFGIGVLSPLVLLVQTPSAAFLGAVLFFCRGLCSGLCGTPVQTLSVIAFDKADIGSVNCIFNACRQVSISLGVALSSVILAFALKYYGHIEHSGNCFEAFRVGFLFITVVAMLGIYITQRLRYPHEADEEEINLATEGTS